jgi:hypothetical protein
MLTQGWPIVDRYRNTTRQNMPDDETITSFADRLIDLAEKLILEQGGQRVSENGSIVYRINAQEPECIRPLERPDDRMADMQMTMRGEIDRLISAGSSNELQARGAYLTICLDMAALMQQRHPQQWPQAVRALESYPNVIQALFHHSPTPLGEELRRKALAAGLKKPPTREDLW